MTNALGKVTSAHQVSIGEKVNLNKINDIFLDNLEKIKVISLKNKDSYSEDIIESLQNNKQLKLHSDFLKPEKKMVFLT